MTEEPIQNIVQGALEETGFGSDKGAEQDVQFSLDSSYGLTRRSYGWYSNGNMFDSTHFSEGDGAINIETSATGTDTARIRSAFPGNYVSHTLAEPSLGVHIPIEHLEYDANDRVSLTHGEISIDAAEINDDADAAVNSLGFSFESDATYIRLRKDNGNLAFVPQEDWNIDPMDGSGPSGDVLRPEHGLVYTMPFTWYGYGSIWFAIHDPVTNKLRPVHRTKIEGETWISTPNLPLQLSIENQGTADPLGADLGGMTFVTHGSAFREDRESTRQTEVTRWTTGSYIGTNATLTNEGIDAFAEPGVPLVAMRRDEGDLDSRVSLSIDVTDLYVNADADLFVATFDEFDPATALTGGTWRDPNIQQLDTETRIEVNTEATTYTPGANAVLRSLVFVAVAKQDSSTIVGDTSTRIPLESTSVVTAILPPGTNATDAQPVILNVREGF